MSILPKIEPKEQLTDQKFKFVGGKNSSANDVCWKTRFGGYVLNLVGHRHCGVLEKAMIQPLQAQNSNFVYFGWEKPTESLTHANKQLWRPCAVDLLTKF